LEEGAAGKIAHELGIDGRALEDKSSISLASRSLAMRIW
jgi:hypothetical protein